MSVCSRVMNDSKSTANNDPLELNQDGDTSGMFDGGLETGGDFDATIPDAFYEDPNAPKLEPEFVMNQVELLPLDEGFDLNEDGQPNNALSLLFRLSVMPLAGIQTNTLRELCDAVKCSSFGLS